MKIFKITSVAVFLAIFLIACVDEPAEALNTQEVIQEISRDWSCNMEEDGSPISFTATIYANSAADNEVFISNFHNMGNELSLSVVVHDDLTLQIPEQIKNNQVFKGTGIISDDYTEITWNYTIEDENGDIIHVTGKYLYGVSS